MWLASALSRRPASLCFRVEGAQQSGHGSNADLLVWPLGLKRCSGIRARSAACNIRAWSKLAAKGICSELRARHTKVAVSELQQDLKKLQELKAAGHVHR